MRPILDVMAFRKAIEEDISRGYKLVSDIEHEVMFGAYRQNDETSESLEATELELRHVLIRIHERLAIAFEYCELPVALARMSKRFDSHAKNLIRLDHVPYVDVLYSPALSDLVTAYESVAACLGGSNLRDPLIAPT